jgi:ankyrin repeat protein
VGEAFGQWEVVSAATTPDAIAETWAAWDGSADVEVGAAKIVRRAAFEAARAAEEEACAAEQVALREPARAAADWRTGQGAAVAARRAAAPPEVRTVLDSALTGVTFEYCHIAPVVAAWLMGAQAVALGDPATKRLAHLVGTTALGLAAGSGRTEAVEQLLEAGAPVRAGGGGGRLPLHYAAEQGHCDVVTQLLVAGAAVDDADEEGCTPLWVAAFCGHDAVVARLLAAGAAVNEAKENGCTPLYIAVQGCHELVVAQLLAAGAAVGQARTTDGIAPLYVAAQKGNVAVVVQLLAAGAPVDKASYDGFTPAFGAVIGGHLSVVKLLVSRGANVHARTASGTLLDCAEQFKFQDIADYLVREMGWACKPCVVVTESVAKEPAAVGSASSRGRDLFQGGWSRAKTT